MNERWDEPVLNLDGLETAGRVLKGERVRVQTIWGHEGGTVQRFTTSDDGFPLAQVLMDQGDVIYIDVARCSPESS